MKLIDVHAHLESSRFKKDLDEVVERFREVGGELIITSGVNFVTNRRALEISEKYSDVVKVSFGIYPIDALANEFESGVLDEHDSGEPEAESFPRDIEKFSVDEELAWIEAHADNCVAIGEIGLDYNWKDFQTNEMRAKQKEVFRKVLKLAKKIGKTVIIHSRKAESDAIEIMEEMKITKAIMHCFNGKRSLIRRCVENGWSFSVPPVIARLDHFKMLAGEVPLEQLLTETDAPYLSPVAGERNESANVLITIKIIAEIKGLEEEEVSKQIFINAKKLFNL